MPLGLHQIFSFLLEWTVVLFLISRRGDVFAELSLASFIAMVLMAFFIVSYCFCKIPIKCTMTGCRGWAYSKRLLPPKQYECVTCGATTGNGKQARTPKNSSS